MILRNTVLLKMQRPSLTGCVELPRYSVPPTASGDTIAPWPRTLLVLYVVSCSCDCET